MAGSGAFSPVSSAYRPTPTFSDILATMTLQVALRGSDGIVLASDTRTSIYDVGEWNEKSQRIRWLNSGTKIQINNKHNLTLAMAGSDLSSMVAACLFEKLDSKIELPDDLANFTVDIADNVYKSRYGDTVGYEATLIIVAPDHKTNQFLRVEIGRRSCPLRVDKKAIAGDAASPAIFFVERYYDEKNIRPTSELLFMAAHVILMGAKLNSGVAGLEFVICKAHAQPERVTDVDGLLKASNALDKILSKKMFSYRS